MATTTQHNSDQFTGAGVGKYLHSFEFTSNFGKKYAFKISKNFISLICNGWMFWPGRARALGNWGSGTSIHWNNYQWNRRTNERTNKQTFLDLILRQEESSRLATFGNYSLLLVPKRFFRNLVQHYRESKLELVASCCISLITLILQSRKFAHGKFESIVILELSLWCLSV